MRHLLSGSARVFLAEALILPTGLVTAAFLTRQLGPDGYGLFTLAATVIAWISWTVSSAFSRASIKLVASVADWHTVGTTVIWANLACGLTATLLLCAVAPYVADAFDQPALSFYVRLFAVDVTLFSLIQGHMQILIGLGRFGARAASAAAFWGARLLAIVLFVSAGFSVTGAIAGSIAASLVQLGICRYQIRPTVFAWPSVAWRVLFVHGAPLLMSAACLRLLTKIDLFALMALGGTAAAAGWYGAAQNLAIVPGLFALSFSPLLLSTVERLQREGKFDVARDTASTAVRLVFGLFPFAALTAATAPEIVVAIFGPLFAPAAPTLALLIFAEVALVIVSVTAALMIASGRLWWTLRIAAPMLLGAIVCHSVLIPRLGARGAALGTTAIAIGGAIVSAIMLTRLNIALPSPASLARTGCLCVLAFFAARFTIPPELIWLKLLAVAVLIAAGYLISGDLSADGRSLIGVRRATRKTLNRSDAAAASETIGTQSSRYS